jgi:tRNA-2-methylthio-N6-dimethylallyladenosine synthase
MAEGPGNFSNPDLLIAPPRLRVPGAPLSFEPHSFGRPRRHARKHPPSSGRFHLWVSGCQMNESDADYLTQGLTAAGFTGVKDIDQADLAILVTCSVRQNAEQKAYGRFRELKGWKQARPGRAIAITGCMANREKDRLFERLPDLDYRFDMRQYEAFIQDLQGEYETDPAQTGGAVLQHGLTAYVPAIFGCNEVCSFCIVPFVRGTERSRPLLDIVDDVQRFARQGVREVTLLGQTINSYRDPQTGDRLSELLQAVERVPGIWRVRFLTSHPRHVHDDLLHAIRDLPRVCEHLHLPFQSADDAILKQMRRRYTRDEFRAIIAHSRELIPDLSVSTDVIVGYPGETEEQFQRTLELLEEISFDVVHIQGFSPRPRTTAARQPDDVSQPEKKRRINLLLEAQRRIAEEANRRWLGRTLEVLVERVEAGELSGRSRQNRVVIATAPLGAEPGTVRRVHIEQATAWQLKGRALN